MAGGAVFSNPAGVMGLGKSWSSVDAEYVAGGAIAAGTAVTFQSDGKVITATTGVATGLQAGVATNDAAATETVHVVHLGLVYVKSDAGVTAGLPLIRSTAVAGNVMAATAQTAGGVIGTAIQAVSADKSGYVLAFIVPATLKTA